METKKLVTEVSISFFVVAALLVLTSQSFGRGLDMLQVINDQEVSSGQTTDSIWGPEEDGMKKQPGEDEPYDRGRPPCLKKDRDLQELVRIERELSNLWYQYRFVLVEFNRLNNIERNPLNGPPMSDAEWAEHKRNLSAVEKSLHNIERDIAALKRKRQDLINRRGCEQSAETSAIGLRDKKTSEDGSTDTSSTDSTDTGSTNTDTTDSGTTDTDTTDSGTTDSTSTSLISNLTDYATGAIQLANNQSSEQDRLRAELKYLGNQIQRKWQEWNQLQRKLEGLKDKLEDLRNATHDPSWSHDEIVRFQEEVQSKMWSLRKEIEYVYHQIDLVEVDIYELRGKEDMIQRKLDELASAKVTSQSLSGYGCI